MQFLAAAYRAKYVVKFKDRTLVQGTIVPQRGLTARFYNHRFDSEQAQRDLGWTDDERRQVEKHLLTHRDFNHPGGIYLDEIVEGKGTTDITSVIGGQPLPAVSGATRCIEFFRDPSSGEAVQCPNMPIEGSDYCGEHIAADDPEPEPVAAGVEGD